MEIPDEMVEALIPAVKQQLESADTAYVKTCLDRLTGKEGLEEVEALELIAQVLAIAVNQMMVSGKPFDVKNYKELLKLLPLLPNEEE